MWEKMLDPRGHFLVDCGLFVVSSRNDIENRLSGQKFWK